MNKFTKLLVVIPTRNRSDLAMNAINSVLTQKNCEHELIVSDNSTESEEIKKLESYCNKLENGKVKYIRPPEPLAMTKHWDWAINEAMQLSDFSHVTYLTDRMIFKDDAVDDLLTVVQAFPEDMIVYTWDSINDTSPPPKLNQYNWSGKIFRVTAEHLIAESAKINFVSALPKMLNSCIPRFVIEKMLEKYEVVFSSIAPDYNFAYTSLSLYNSVLFYDKTLLISYSLSRSNGYNQLSGILSKDTVDFLNNIKEPLSIDTPLPYLLTPTDAVLNEYYFVKNKKNNKFPPVDKKTYLLRMITDVMAFKDKAMRRKMLLRCYKKVGIKTFQYHFRGILPIRTIIKSYFHRHQKVNGNNSLHVKESKFETMEKALDFARKSYLKPFLAEEYIKEKTGAKPSIAGAVKEEFLN